jgi:ATP-binding cassette subfamily C (CFTR/MRP) protein 4
MYFLFQSLRLTKTALRETSVGQAVNLLSNDVAYLDRTIVFLPFLLIGPVQTAVIVNFMWKKIGLSAVIGAASVLLFIPLQGLY